MASMQTPPSGRRFRCVWRFRSALAGRAAEQLGHLFFQSIQGIRSLRGLRRRRRRASSRLRRRWLHLRPHGCRRRRSCGRRPGRRRRWGWRRLGSRSRSGRWGWRGLRSWRRLGLRLGVWRGSRSLLRFRRLTHGALNRAPKIEPAGGSSRTVILLRRLDRRRRRWALGRKPRQARSGCAKRA